MVGIGGAGMSGLARILLARAARCRDRRQEQPRHTRAADQGARADRARSSALDQLPGGPTAVVTTYAAIPKTNPELVAARSRGVPVLLRPVVLAELMAGFRTLLIAGTRQDVNDVDVGGGALQHCGLDPSFAVGGELNESAPTRTTAPARCSWPRPTSDGSLLEYRPDVVVVTNIEADHLDHFGTREAYVESSTGLPSASPTTARWSSASTTRGRRRLAGRCHEALPSTGC